jgi:hypothetical protein
MEKPRESNHPLIHHLIVFLRGFSFFIKAVFTCGGTNELTSPPNAAISFTMRELKKV